MFSRAVPASGLLALTLLCCGGSQPGAEPAAQPGGSGGAVGGSAPVGGSGGMSTPPDPAGGAGGTGGGMAAGSEASVVTWNLDNFPLTADAPALAAELLGQLSPDVAALEEIADPVAFANLLGAMPGYQGVLNDDPEGFTRLGLVYKAERVTVSDVETLFHDDWYAFPRPPLKVHVAIDGPEPIDFVVVVIHLKAQLDAESQARRRAGCERLEAWVRAELSSESEQDFLLLGDFNDELTDPPDGNVFAAFLDRPAQYGILTMPLAEAGEHSYVPFESMIDHVVATSDMLVEVGSGQTEVLALEQSVSGYDRLTDHRPVRSWLRPTP
jgi:endonuclease/exonuclease/phosphatase family metal-dependent hydrolase